MLLILIASLTFFIAPAGSETVPAQAADHPMDTLVTVEWLGRHLDDPDLVVLDCTVNVVMDESGGMKSVSGRADYEKGHIPGAAFADLMVDLSDTGSPLKTALPTPEQFCAAIGALGVGDDTRVVLYDGTYSVWAARVWWMLRWVGFDQAAILDGGSRAWTAAEQPLATEPPDYPTRKLTPHVRPALIADRDEVFAAIDDETVFLIDAMPEFHFQGKMALYDRPGHIPSATNISAMALLGESGQFLPQEKLAKMFDIDLKARAITYCGSGIAASSTAFIMHRLGFADVAVYIASLQEWTADPENPLVVEEP